MKKTGTVLAVCLGESRKKPKKPVLKGIMIKDYGLKGDVHAGRDHKQISLLSLKSLEKNRKQGFQLGYGDLFENIDFDGIDDLYLYPIGTQIKIGRDIVLSITQIGKEHEVEIIVKGQKVNSIMPEEGIFACVVKGGSVSPGDMIEVVKKDD